MKTSAEGHIAFNCPTIHGGQPFDDIRLTFRRGRVVEGSATDGADRLARILDTDAGSRFLGEFAFGLNPGITRPMRNILFDEKISARSTSRSATPTRSATTATAPRSTGTS